MNFPLVQYIFFGPVDSLVDLQIVSGVYVSAFSLPLEYVLRYLSEKQFNWKENFTIFISLSKKPIHID